MDELKMKLTSIFIIVLSIFLTACSKTYHVYSNPPLESEDNAIRHVAVFLDGTANDIDSHTNVARLSQIVRNQNIANLHAFYNEGVGTDYRVIGGGTGWGIDKDVVEAYAFLTYAYKPDSKLYFFGFSRGAYTARILAGMVYSIGIYDFSDKTEKERLKLSRSLYDLYKGIDKEDFINDIPDIIECNLDNSNKKLLIYNDECDIKKEAIKAIGHEPKYSEVKINAMGIWDTVEALGVIPTIRAASRNMFGVEDTVDIINPNNRYIDQVCNIEHVYHALALDDNREYVFTPISINTPYTVSRCIEKQDSVEIKEVWFSGAHADVGGGYSPLEQTDGDQVDYIDLRLSGVSLNWMLQHLRQDTSLVLSNVLVQSNELGYIHDAENGSKIYQEKTRGNVFKHFSAISNNSTSSEKYRITVHRSAINRVTSKGYLEHTDLQSHQKKRKFGRFNKFGFDSQWYEQPLFEKCFVHSDDGQLKFLEECEEFDVE